MSTLPEIRGRHSVFWRVAAVLILVQLATGLFSIGLSAYLASDRSRDLALNSLRVRMDAIAEEIERTAAPLDQGLRQLPVPILQNLSYRFPDPVVLVDTSGAALFTLHPDAAAFDTPVADSSEVPVIPPAVLHVFEDGDVEIDAASDVAPGGWAAAPLYDASGILVGGFVVQPIRRTMARELAPARTAFRTALWTVSVVSVLLAALLAGVFTSWLIRPLRRITSRVLEIGAGNYDARVEVRGTDEIARLGETVNQMAAQVARSVESLRNTDRMRRELIANVGHDLRTPLAALAGYIEESRRFHAEARYEEGLKAMESAGAQAVYLQRLVDDLFELSLLENPSPQLRREPVPLAELLHDVGRNHTGQMQARGIHFSVEVPSSLPVIEADGVRLMRVLDNLLSNARRHTRDGDSIRVGAAVTTGSVEIEVSDTGEGLDAESLERIFDRYYRGEASRTRDRHGTGLGLAIARAVVELHGGSLTAESEPGQGMRMRMRLPVPSESPGTVQDAPEPGH